MLEQTLIILKPDTLLRGLVGNVMDRFEKVGLKLVACKMTQADDALLKKMYDANNKKYVTSLGEKTLELYKSYEVKTEGNLSSEDPYQLGLEVTRQLQEYMKSSPVIVQVWEGVKAIDIARKIRGSTTPLTASVGTILGDFSHDSQFAAPQAGRSLRNLVHASSSKEDAQREISLWFGKDFQPLEYDRADSIFF